jgi:uncharacterized membrane protein YcaP (DUF421 family)
MEMFTLSMSAVELVLRAAIIYVFLFVLLRLAGKRHVGELAPFDLVVLLLLSESVQNALVGTETSILGGVIAAGTLMGLTTLVGYLSWRGKPIERLFEGKPRVLVRNGHVCGDVLAREQINRNELVEALRRAGCTSLNRVRYAVLEVDGSITVGLRVPSAKVARPN